VEPRRVVGKEKRAGGRAFMDHAWFCRRRPGRQAEIALSVLSEHGGHGGSTAAPLAKKAIESVFSEQGKHRATAAAMPKGDSSGSESGN